MEINKKKHILIMNVIVMIDVTAGAVFFAIGF